MVQAVCGGTHTIALTDEGRIFIWGRGSFGAKLLQSDCDSCRSCHTRLRTVINASQHLRVQGGWGLATSETTTPPSASACQVGILLLSLLVTTSSTLFYSVCVAYSPCCDNDRAYTPGQQVVQC